MGVLTCGEARVAMHCQGDIEFRRIWLTALPPMIERQNGTREP